MGPLAILLTVLALLSPTAPPSQISTPGSAPAGLLTARETPQPVGVWPVQPRPPVVQGFDPPSNPYGAGHRGVDLLGAVGEPVHTALAGTVTYAGLLAGIEIVVIDHGATRTTYQPVTASVTVGTAVAKGAVIGSLGLAGSHCPPAACLHWGWIRNAGPAGPQMYLDPLGLVGDTPMRLLPLEGGSD